MQIIKLRVTEINLNCRINFFCIILSYFLFFLIFYMCIYMYMYINDVNRLSNVQKYTGLTFIIDFIENKNSKIQEESYAKILFYNFDLFI